MRFNRGMKNALDSARRKPLHLLGALNECATLNTTNARRCEILISLFRFG